MAVSAFWREISAAEMAWNPQGGDLKRMKLRLICSGILAFFQIAQAANASGASAMGKQIFMNNCVTCHGVTGKGIPQPEAPEIPDLRSAKVQQLSDTDLAAIISNGQKSMPAWKG
jgi:mono/diheme cytochrome c family protein